MIVLTLFTPWCIYAYCQPPLRWYTKGSRSWSSLVGRPIYISSQRFDVNKAWTLWEIALITKILLQQLVVIIVVLNALLESWHVSQHTYTSTSCAHKWEANVSTCLGSVNRSPSCSTNWSWRQFFSFAVDFNFHLLVLLYGIRGRRQDSRGISWRDDNITEIWILLLMPNQHRDVSDDVRVPSPPSVSQSCVKDEWGRKLLLERSENEHENTSWSWLPLISS